MEPVKNREWKIRGEKYSFDGITAISEGLKISPLVSRLLCLRGLTDPVSADLFLNGKLASIPDPFNLKGMTAAVDRLIKAISSGEKILVHGDYDVDGISGTALLVEFLSLIGAEVGYHIPLRLKDGYGLSPQAFEKALGQGVTLVVSVDCGVTAVAEAQLARDYGIDLIITDHHQAPETLPDAVAIVNPHQPECSFPDKNLAGVGVAFFLAIGLRKSLRDASYFSEARPEPDIRHLLDLVALGTIADVVPLTGVNRVLTSVGLQVLNGGARIGVRALQKVAAVKEIDSGAVGFKLGPRLNAAGRIEDAALGVKLLLENNEETTAEIAGLLDDFNRERQSIETKTLRQAEEAVAELDAEKRTIVLADPEWHPGVIGIVASRLVERFNRPTFLLAIENDQARGSGRSTRDIHLYQALQECAEILLGYGGHAAAAGLSLATESITSFAAGFEAAVVGQQAESLAPFIEFDGEVLLEDLTQKSIKELALLAPFGMGNPSPVFVVRNVSILGAKVVGDKHLKFSARQGGFSLSAIAFGMAERQDELEGEVDLLFAPELNEWNGRIGVQLKVKDWQSSVM